MLQKQGGKCKNDNRQITHLICVRLKKKHLLYDFSGGGGLGLLPVVFLIQNAQPPP